MAKTLVEQVYASIPGTTKAFSLLYREVTEVMTQYGTGLAQPEKE